MSKQDPLFQELKFVPSSEVTEASGDTDSLLVGILTGQIRNIAERIEKNEKERSRLLSEKRELDSHDMVVHWEDTFEEKRSTSKSWWSRKEFDYRGIPFCIIEYEAKNGAWVESETIFKPQEGIYRRVYQSNFWQDGWASVKILIAKKNMPANKKRISDIDSELTATIEELQRLRTSYRELIELNFNILKLEQRSTVESLPSPLLKMSILTTDNTGVPPKQTELHDQSQAKDASRPH